MKVECSHIEISYKLDVLGSDENRASKRVIVSSCCSAGCTGLTIVFFLVEPSFERQRGVSKEV